MSKLPARPPFPAIPPSQLPQTIAPTRASKALQFAAFTLGTGIAFYAVLLYDFGQEEHCFMPVRRWFDDASRGLFTLSDRDRALISTPLPSTNTPFEFFKREVQTEGKREEEAKKAV